MPKIMDGKQEDINYKLLLDIVPHPLVLSNSQGVVTYINTASRKLGIRPGSSIWNQPFQGLPNCTTIDEFNTQISSDFKLSITGKPDTFDIRLARYATRGSDYYLYSLNTNHTKFNLPAALKDSADDLRDIKVEEIEDYAILMLDNNGNIINGNKGIQNVKGYTVDEIIGRHFETFYPEQDRIDGLPQKMLKEAQTKGKAIIEGWRIRKDGSLFWANIVITAVHDTDGKIVGFTKVTRDLTDSKLDKEQLIQQTKRIEAKNRQLEEFAYIASHDLQEPLRKISIFTNFIEKNISNHNYVENYLHKISSSVKRMSSLINDILGYARVLENPGEQKKIDLKEIVDGVLDDFELLISEKRVSIVFLNILPVLSAIPVQMRQLFTNLINNAIKFSPNKPTIKISCEQVVIGNNHDRLAKGNYHRISLADNGMGFDQQYATEIFKPFKRLKGEISGSGIGLAVCQKIVENHGGAIEVSSIQGEGTTFKVLLPAETEKLTLQD